MYIKHETGFHLIFCHQEQAWLKIQVLANFTVFGYRNILLQCLASEDTVGQSFLVNIKLKVTKNIRGWLFITCDGGPAILLGVIYKILIGFRGSFE